MELTPRLGGALCACLAAGAAIITVASSRPAAAAGPLPSASDPVAAYFLDWFERSERTKTEQPHWITPLATVTPRLEQELRFDQIWAAQPHGLAESDSGGARLELIPARNVELILSAPPYVARSRYQARGRSHGLDNFGDVSFLVKYRLAAANEGRGNYIVTAFMGFSAPTGPKRIGAGHALFTPTLAFGKGWGAFDFQSTLSTSLPNGGMDRLGMPVAYNTVLQYRLLGRIWPELEFNYTWWPNGQRTGQNQLFLTPGVVIGRLSIFRTFGLTIGTGFQAAVTRHRTADSRWLLSVRLPF